MEDTAQPVAAETPLHDQLDQAAIAIRQMRTVNQNRDEAGKFVSDVVEDEPTEELDEESEGEEVENDEPEYDENEAPEEDQAEAVEMPKSWSKEDEAAWLELSPAAQAKVAEREGQRDAALNTKFQEVANERKAYEAKLQEANSSRDKWAQDYDLLVSDLSIPKPDPRHYGLGSGNYDREAYDMALLDYEQTSEKLGELKTQRQNISAQQEKEQLDAQLAIKERIDAEHGPKLFAVMPELQDQAKAIPAIQGLVRYAIDEGLDPETFAADNQPYITAIELQFIAKARKYDELMSGKSKPAPKKQPAIRPGVASPRSAQKGTQVRKAMSRLQSENSIEAAAQAMRLRRQ